MTTPDFISVLLADDNQLDYTAFRVDRVLSALKALGSPRYQELVKTWETELVKAEREGKEFTWEDALGEEDTVPPEFGAQEAGQFEEQESQCLAVAKLEHIVRETPSETLYKEP